MPEPGHVRLVCTVVGRLVEEGLRVAVLTHRDFREDVAAAGAEFVDLFAARPVAEVDAESRPVPCRYVSWAGAHAEPVIEEARRLEPDLILYETFSVVAPIVARALGVPAVNVCVGHDVEPTRLRAELERDPRVSISERCHWAVDRLRGRHGMRDASPFSYVSALSPVLNLYGEPPQFLAPAQRPAFDPLAFFGSIPDDRHRGEAGRSRRARGDGVRRVYAGFGTIVWRYWPDEAEAILLALARATPRLGLTHVTVGLGGARLGPATSALLRNAGFEIVSFVDQWESLRDADVFLTHHGINSTHEAIYHGVPMISCPFFWDQPRLAAHCQRLGLAIPLVEGAPGDARAAPGEAEVLRAFERLAASRARMEGRLETARSWELEAIAGRSAVVARIRALAGRRDRASRGVTGASSPSHARTSTPGSAQ